MKNIHLKFFVVLVFTPAVIYHLSVQLRGLNIFFIKIISFDIRCAVKTGDEENSKENQEN